MICVSAMPLFSGIPIWCPDFEETKRILSATPPMRSDFLIERILERHPQSSLGEGFALILVERRPLYESSLP